MRRGIWIVLLLAAVLLAGCVLKDWSGLTMDSQRRIFAVNNRPGAFGWCTEEKNEDGQGSHLDCTPLPFDQPRYARFDFEGVAWVGDNLFYAVIEKRNNQCMSGCDLSQEVLAFRIDKNGKVASAACSPVLIPLLQGDDPGCSFANCGLEGIAFDPSRRLLYVAKEAFKPRLFAVQLDAYLCPTGSFVPIAPPEVLQTYNDLSYSQKRGSLFILSTRDQRFYEWHLDSNTVVVKSEDIPELDNFLKTTPVVEGVFVDDRSDSVMLLAESGAFIKATLPPSPFVRREASVP